MLNGYRNKLPTSFDFPFILYLNTDHSYRTKHGHNILSFFFSKMKYAINSNISQNCFFCFFLSDECNFSPLICCVQII